MKRDVGVYLEDIAESIKHIEEYTKGVKEADFYRDTKLQDAVLRRLEIIGEAVKKIPQAIKSKYPDVPWKEIAGTRDILSHEYFRVNLERIWKTIQEDLLPFKEKIEEILKKFP